MFRIFLLGNDQTFSRVKSLGRPTGEADTQHKHTHVAFVLWMVAKSHELTPRNETKVETIVCWYLQGVIIPGFRRWCRSSSSHSRYVIVRLVRNRWVPLFWSGLIPFARAIYFDKRLPMPRKRYTSLLSRWLALPWYNNGKKATTRVLHVSLCGGGLKRKPKGHHLIGEPPPILIDGGLVEIRPPTTCEDPIRIQSHMRHNQNPVLKCFKR